MAQAITMRQRVAINRARLAGRKIAKKYPSIAEDYDAGTTQAGLVREYSIMEEFGLTEKIAINAVQNALYELMPDRMEELARQHLSESGRRLHREGIGAFSLPPERRVEILMESVRSRTPEDMAEAGRKGGLKGGPKGGPRSQELGVGIHGLTSEERSTYGRMAAAAAWGVTPWPDEEKAYFSELCRRYIHDSGPQKGRPRYSIIMEELEERFHNGRTLYSLREMSKKLRKRAGT